jgi:hypothetical protein
MSSAAPASRTRQAAGLLEGRDQYGFVLFLILATIMVTAVAQDGVGKVIAVALSGSTLLFVLHTSEARRRPSRVAAAIVVLAMAGAATGLILDLERGEAAANLVGLLLAFVAPLVILRRIVSSSTITFRLVLGALCIYLLIGLAYSYLYPLVAIMSGTPFFIQTSEPASIDYLYFSYVTLTTVGYGDYTAATGAGRMLAVSEALSGQLYLVSAVALMVANIGRTIDRGPRRGGGSPAPDTGAVEPPDLPPG